MRLEFTEKLMFASEQGAEDYIENLKAQCIENGTTLTDWKISLKETKDGEYCIVTIKIRELSLAEGKEKMYG